MAKGTTIIPAVAVIIRRGNAMLFAKRANTGFQDGKYCLPAGHVEPGETFREAAVREVMEEVGLQADPAKLRFVHVQQTMTPRDIRVHVFFELDDWRGEPVNAEPAVHSEIAWLPSNDLPYDDMMGLIAAGLRQVAQGSAYDEFVSES
jgi:mutator protein MutT